VAGEHLRDIQHQALPVIRVDLDLRAVLLFPVFFPLFLPRIS
jgi:hypothetical protein